VAKPGAAERAIRHMERATRLLTSDRPEEAIREARSAKSAAPRSAAVREVLGLALYRSERWRDALAEMSAYRRMSGRQDQNHIIADCHRALGHPEKAVPLAEEALRAPRVPEDVKAEAVVVAAAALADVKRYEEALSLLRRARTKEDVATPATLRIWYVTADVLARAGRREEALEVFRRIMRHDAAAFDVAERVAQLA
jgi:tetratricopeptide (TPR) repeat protein